MNNLASHIKLLRKNGKYYFTTSDALKALSINRNGLACAVYKLKQKGDIVTPAKGLYITVPPEFQSIGSLAPEELIPILMAHWKIKNYYVGLLTAALYHGASHQKPQIFQVITNKQLNPISLGKVKIEFIVKKNLSRLRTDNRAVKTGYLTLSSPELTAMDLFLYPSHTGLH